MRIFFACLIAFCVPVAWCLEGSIDSAVRKRGTELLISLSYSENSIEGIAKDFNNQGLLKLAVDRKLARKRLKDVRFDNSNAFIAADKLATELKVKAFAVNDFIYIGEKLPPGAKLSDGTPASLNPAAALVSLDAVFPGVKPGAYRKLPWVSSTPQEVRETGKPVLFYVFDPDDKSDWDTPNFWESVILADPAVAKELDGFNFVLIQTDNKDWPAGFTARAKGGAALYLMTSAGQVVATFDAKTPKGHLVAFAQAAANTKRANGPVAPKKPEAQAADAGKEPEKEPNKIGIAGLGGEKPEDPRKPEPDKPKPPKLEDE